MTECIDNSQPGFRIQNDKVDLFVTRNGGHMAPVRFCVDTASPVQPYYLSPWQNEGLETFPDPLLVPLRGDFFCMPFGGNGEVVDGENHPAHGEVSSSEWALQDASKEENISTLSLELSTKVREGKTAKRLYLVDGQNVVYTSHILEGYSGKMPIGHHCILDVPEEEGSLRVAFSPFEMGMTAPTLFSDPANGEYQSLAINKRFTDLAEVPTLWKDAPLADCSFFPARLGYTDLIGLFKKPSAQPAWTTAACPSRGYLWFCLKDAAMLPSSLLWISNKGRHGYPWNGRNRCLGLEETVSYFADGLGPSARQNALSEAGFPTALALSPEAPTSVNFIQGIAPIPADFENVKTLEFGAGTATFLSDSGQEITVDVCHEFLRTGTF